MGVLTKEQIEYYIRLGIKISENNVYYELDYTYDFPYAIILFDNLAMDRAVKEAVDELTTNEVK